jgi:hypothetical protein
MTLSKQIPIETEMAILKLKSSLEQINQKIDNSDFTSYLSESMSLINTFYQDIGYSEFYPQEFKKGDTPKAELYNQNLNQIFNDLNRFYLDLDNLNNLAIASYNYSQVVISEVKRRAQDIASTVLDLNILSNFTNADAIVAGDDFTTSQFIDKDANYSNEKVEPMIGGFGVTLSRLATRSVLEDAEIDIFPVAPVSNKSNTVNTKTTPGNIERFYEGSYYDFLGAARPEGGSFNFKYLNLSAASTGQGGLSTQVTLQEQSNLGDYVTGGNDFIPPSPSFDTLNENGYFYDAGATLTNKKLIRNKMIDGNPDTFWECEYLFKLENPLVSSSEFNDLAISESASLVDDSESFNNQQNVTESNFEIEADQLNSRAEKQDTADLIVDIVFTLKEDTWINFVSINPVVFSKNSFIEILDIATSSSEQSAFTTVDGWNSLRFAKAITPEANEYLTDSQSAALLAPNRSSYLGQGIYPFPMRFAKKIKVRVKSSLPVAQVYERTYVLMKNVTDIELSFHKRTKRGW